jgi:hypothetical protein
MNARLAGLGALLVALGGCTQGAALGRTGSADGVEDVSTPKKAAQALLAEIGVAALETAKSALEMRDANISQVSQTFTPNTQEPYLGTSPVMPCFADPAIVQRMTTVAETAAQVLYDSPGGDADGTAWFTALPKPDASGGAVRFFDDSAVFPSGDAASVVQDVYACAGIPTSLSEAGFEDDPQRRQLTDSMRVVGSAALKSAYSRALQRYVTNVWMKALAGQTVADADRSFIANVVQTDVDGYLGDVTAQLSSYVQTLTAHGATFSTIAPPDGQDSTPYQGFVYLSLANLDLTGIDAGIAAKDPETVKMLAAVGVLGGIPLMQQMVKPTAGKLTVVSSGILGNPIYFLAIDGVRQFMTPEQWQAQVQAQHDAFVEHLKAYYQDAQQAASTMVAVRNILESILSDVNLDQTPEVQAENGEYADLLAILDQLGKLGLPPDSYGAYCNALIEALMISNAELSALIAQLDKLIPDFDPIHGKFHLGLYWAIAVPIVAWLAPELAASVLGEGVADAVVASQAQVVDFAMYLWAGETAVQTGIDVFYAGESPVDALVNNALDNSFDVLPNLAIGFAVPIPATLVGGPSLGVAKLFGASAETALAVGKAGYTVTDYGTALLFLGALGVGTYDQVGQAIQDLQAASKLQATLDQEQAAGGTVDAESLKQQIAALHDNAAQVLGSVIANVGTIGVVSGGNIVSGGQSK